MLKKLALFWCAMALLGAGAGAARADLIVNSGPDDGGTYTGGSVLSYNLNWVAQQFLLPQAYTITQVQGLIGYSTIERGGNIQAVIRADNSNHPGEKLQEQTFTASNPGYTTWQGPSGLNWTLEASTYWLAFEVYSPSTFDGAMKVISGDEGYDHMLLAYAPGPSFAYIAHESYNTRGIRVYGDPSAVPLPPTVFLLGSGLLGLVGLRRFRKS